MDDPLPCNLSNNSGRALLAVPFTSSGLGSKCLSGFRVRFFPLPSTCLLNVASANGRLASLRFFGIFHWQAYEVIGRASSSSSVS